MEIGEVRKFKIDKNKKKECKLQPSKQGIIEIEIKKEKNKNPGNLEDPTKFIYKLVGPENLSEEAFLKCDYGHVYFLKTKGKAEKCGIGRIFTELCMNEKNLHKTTYVGENKNLAIGRLDKFIKDSNNRPDYKLLVKHVKLLKKWSKSQCSELIYLLMAADPPSNAHVYFNSAMASGFTEMFMTTEPLDDNDLDELDFYPLAGPCSTKNLQDRYSDDGDMVDGNTRKDVVGWNWFFCKPKEPTVLNKCTIL